MSCRTRRRDPGVDPGPRDPQRAAAMLSAGRADGDPHTVAAGRERRRRRLQDDRALHVVRAWVDRDDRSVVLVRYPDGATHGRERGRAVADRDHVQDVAARRLDALDRTVEMVRDPDRPVGRKDGRRLVPDGLRQRDRGGRRIDASDAVRGVRDPDTVVGRRDRPPAHPGPGSTTALGAGGVHSEDRRARRIGRPRAPRRRSRYPSGASPPVASGSPRSSQRRSG